MLPIVIKILKFASFPMLLAGGMLPRISNENERVLAVAICLAVLGAASVAMVKREYFLTVALVAAAVVFSPLLLIAKIFLLMSLALVVTFLTLFAAFRTQAVSSDNDIQP